MSSSDQIVDHLRIVAAERAARHDEPGLNEKVLAIKRYQQLRFRHTYADLLESTRYPEFDTNRPFRTFSSPWRQWNQQVRDVGPDFL